MRWREEMGAMVGACILCCLLLLTHYDHARAPTPSWTDAQHTHASPCCPRRSWRAMMVITARRSCSLSLMPRKAADVSSNYTVFVCLLDSTHPHDTH